MYTIMYLVLVYLVGNIIRMVTGTVPRGSYPEETYVRLVFYAPYVALKVYLIPTNYNSLIFRMFAVTSLARLFGW